MPLLALLAFSPAKAESDAGLADLDLARLLRIPITSAARHEQSRSESQRSVSVITAEEIRRRNFRNVPEAVAGLTGVFLQQTNYAGGSPIIRGLVGNRILVLINGIRLNNATYRYGPNQYLNFIDINQVDRIEIVRGAGSVLYGSDAFGGVINVITRQAPDPSAGAEFSGRARLRAASADRSGAGRLEFSGTSGKVGLFGGYTQEGFSDLRAGGNSGTQTATGYGQWAGDMQLRFAAGSNRSLTLGATRLRQLGAERTDSLRAATDLEYRWAPEGQDLIYTRFVQDRPARRIDRIEVTASFQRPVEDVDRIVAADPRTERHSFDGVLGHTFSVQFTSTLGRSHHLAYGAETRTDRVVSRRTDINLPTGRLVPAKGTYSDGSRFSSGSIFLQDEIGLPRGLAAVLGLRQDWFGARADLDDPAVGRIHLRSSPSALTGSSFLLAPLNRSVTLVAGASQGFRAPNIDDSTVLGGSGSRFEVPNAGLEPERSTAFECGARFKTGRLIGSVVFFNDSYRDLIDRAPGLFNGLPFIDSNRDGVRNARELDVYQRQNIGRALVRGIETESVMTFGQNWTWTHTLTWTYGTDQALGAPLTRIPPLNGVSRLTWQPKPALWFELAAVAAAPQRRLSAGDKADVRIGPAGTAGFVVLHLRACLNRGPLAGLSIAWENFTDRRYRLHGSGFDRPGSGVVLGYQRAF